MQYLSRREIREAEKLSQLESQEEAITPTQKSDTEFSKTAAEQGKSQNIVSLTRRQLRDLEAQGGLDNRRLSPSSLNDTGFDSAPSAATRGAKNDVVEHPSSDDEDSKHLSALNLEKPVKTNIYSRRQLREQAAVTPDTDVDLEAVTDVAPPDFRKRDMFAELPTNTFTFDTVPEALSKEIYYDEYGEPLTTGTIRIVTESVGIVTSPEVDNILDVDQIAVSDSVMGHVSTVEPVSAAAVIRDRRATEVLPKNSLSRSRVMTTVTSVTGIAMILAGIAALVWAYQEYGPGF